MSGGPGGHRVRVLRHAELDETVRRAWLALEERALEPNAFLSPLFVLPAVRHLASEEAAAGLRFVIVERDAPAPPRALGLAVLQGARANRGFPLSHARAFRSVHSYLSGFLLDRAETEPAARALLSHLHGARWIRHGVEVEEWPADGPQAEILFRVAGEVGFRWCEWRRARRAVLEPGKAGPQFLEAHLSGTRKKKVRRAHRELEHEGPVRWRLVNDRAVDGACIERFLRVEDDGWKEAQLTSILSRNGDAAFCREAMRSFAEAGRLFFTELLVGDEVVASTSNFVSGNAGFAFKVGWRQRFARAGPGYLNELEFVRHAPALGDRLAWIDSGAGEGSFIESLWTGRRELVRGTFARGLLGGLAARSSLRLRAARDSWRTRRRGPTDARQPSPPSDSGESRGRGV
jgi:CelD/BcsL family acetyltransferase involved in cellulose biosynthesis